jgi:hypothetical protein
MHVKFQSGLRLTNASVLRLSPPAEAYPYFLFKTNCDHLTLHTDKLQSAMTDAQFNPVLRHLSYVCLI